MKNFFNTSRIITFWGVCWLAVMLGAVLMLGITAGRSRGSFFVPFNIFADSLIPLLFTALALYYPKKKLITISASIFWLLTIFLRVFAIAIYDSGRLALNYDSLKMLWAHSGHQGLQAVLGQFYYLWFVLFAALLAGGLFLLHYRNNLPEKTSSECRTILGAGIITALVFTAGFLITAACPVKLEVIYSGHLTRPLPVSCFEILQDAWHRSRRVPEKAEVYPQSSAENKKLEEAGLLRQAEDSLGLFNRFDKLLIIAVESLDWRFITDPMMPSGVTPVLQDLVKRYPHFDNYFTAAQPTTRGLYAMLSSRLNPEMDLMRQKPLPTLFSLAAAQGVETYYFSPLPGSFADNDVLYRKYFGMKHCYFLEEWQQMYGWKRDNFWGVDDEKIYSAALEVLQQAHPEKFVALISTIDTHPPYTCSGSFAETAKQKFQEPFLCSLYCADCYLGRFLRKFTADKKLFDEKTLVIVTADHSATHGVNFLKRSDYTPDRIPLIFIPGKDFSSERINFHAPSSAIDFAPLAAAFLGLPVPKSFAGRIPVNGKHTALSFNDGVIFSHTLQSGETAFPENPTGLPDAVQVFYQRYYR